MSSDAGKQETMRVVLEAIKTDSVLTGEGVPCTEDELKKIFSVNITVLEPYIIVDLAPWSEEGHDYMFRIDMATGKVDQKSIAIGEIIPMPRDAR